jgi:hypothetical protein
LAVVVFAKLVAAEAFECDFSTSTDVERTAGRIVLMDAYSPTGTAEDWRKIRDRVTVIAGFGLEDWCRVT